VGTTQGAGRGRVGAHRRRRGAMPMGSGTRQGRAWGTHTGAVVHVY